MTVALPSKALNPRLIFRPLHHLRSFATTSMVQVQALKTQHKMLSGYDIPVLGFGVGISNSAVSSISIHLESYSNV